MYMRVELLRDNFTAAEPFFVRSLHAMKAAGREGYLAYTYAQLLPCVAFRGDWEVLDLYLEETSTRLTTSGIVDTDIAYVLEQAGTVTAKQGETERAHAIWTLAAAHWRACKDEAAAARVISILNDDPP